jgi:hypothetical protein
VTYSYTTRGMYHPPPREELGEIVSDSINADPVGIVKSLGDRAGGEGEDDGDGPPMPPVFAEVESAVSRHLTMKKPPLPAIVEYEVGSTMEVATMTTATAARRRRRRWAVRLVRVSYSGPRG